MVVYADTSFLFSLYAMDGNSAQAHAERLETPIAFTAFQRYELLNALRLSVFRKEMTAPQHRAVQALIATDMRQGVLSSFQVNWAEVYTHAEALSTAYTPKIGCRALDVLHVAIAQVLNINMFYTFDIRQRKLACKVDLHVKPR